MAPELTWIKDVSLVEGIVSGLSGAGTDTTSQKHLQQAGNIEKISWRQFGMKP